MRHLGRVAALCALLAGCLGSGDGDASAQGGDGGAPPLPRSQRSPDTMAHDVCSAHLAWNMRCAAMDPQPRDDPYWGETECPQEQWQWVQPAYIEAAASCFETLSCDAADDVCTAAGLAAVGIEREQDVAGDALYQRCLTVAAACDDFIDDQCLAFLVYTSAGRQAATACLDLECSAIEGCIEDLS